MSLRVVPGSIEDAIAALNLERSRNLTLVAIAAGCFVGYLYVCFRLARAAEDRENERARVRWLERVNNTLAEVIEDAYASPMEDET